MYGLTTTLTYVKLDKFCQFNLVDLNLFGKENKKNKKKIFFFLPII